MTVYLMYNNKVIILIDNRSLMIKDLNSVLDEN